MKINPQFLQHQINSVLLEYPDLKDDPELRADTLEGCTDLKEALMTLFELNDKDDEYLIGIMAKQAERRMRQQRIERRIASRRAMMLKIMQWADLKRVELPEATLSQRAGQRKVLGDPDVDLLPDDFVKITVTREPDKAAIKEALLRGEFVPECSLSNAEPTLAIHPK
jgi:hypothetical protein